MVLDCLALRFFNELKSDSHLGPDLGMASALNFAIKFGLFAETERLVSGGLIQNVDDDRRASLLVGEWLDSIWPHIEFNHNEIRALTVGVAYRDRLSPKLRGPKDGRMKAALAAVAEADELGGDEPGETLDRMNRKTRARARGQYYLRLDRENLTVELVNAESVLFANYPEGSGRPPNS